MATDLTFGLGVAGMFLLGIILILVGYFGKKEIGQKPAKWFMGFGLIAIVISAVVYAGVIEYLNPPEEQIVPSASYDVTASDAQAWVSEKASTHTITIAMDYNTTSNLFVGGTGVATVNFTVSRSDALVDDAVASLAIGSVPMVDVVGSTDEYMVDQNADDSFNALWTKAGGFTQYESMNILVEAGGSAWATITFTMNGAAAHAMTTNDIVSMNLSIAGESWTVQFLADNIHV